MLTVVEAERLNQSFQEKIIPPSKARALTNRFILEHLQDGFCAGCPCYALVQADPVWIVPIVFSRPKAALAEVGELIIQALSAAIIGFTPPGEVLKNARAALAG